MDPIDKIIERLDITGKSHKYDDGLYSALSVDNRTTVAPKERMFDMTTALGQVFLDQSRSNKYDYDGRLGGVGSKESKKPVLDTPKRSSMSKLEQALVDAESNRDNKYGQYGYGGLDKKYGKEISLGDNISNIVERLFL